MTAALIFIASCLIGALLIEIHARILVRRRIERRLSGLIHRDTQT